MDMMTYVPHKSLICAMLYSHVIKGVQLRTLK